MPTFASALRGEPALRSVSSGKTLTKSQLYDAYLKQFPEDKDKITPDQVWEMHAAKPDKYQVLPKTNPVNEYLLETASNIPSSAGSLVKGIVGLVNPNTYKNIGNMVMGGLYRDIPDPNRTTEQQQAVDMNQGFKDALAERYSHPLDTIRTDPLGAAADISTVVGGGAGLVRGVARMTGSATLGRVAAGMGRVSDAINPFEAVSEMARLGLSKTNLPRRLYRSSLSPLAGQSSDDILKTADYGLYNAKVPRNKAGRDAADQMVKDDVAYMDAKAQEAERKGLRYDPVRGATEIDAANADVQDMTFPQDAERVLEQRKRQFLEKKGGAQFDPETGAMTVPPSDISPVEARKMWKSQNREMEDAINDKTENLSAKLQSVRAIRKSITDQFREWFPELKDIGQRDAILIDLRNMIEADLKRQYGGESAPHSSVYALAHSGQAIASGHISPIAAATGAKHILSAETRSRLALRLAHKYPGLVSKYATPQFMAEIASVAGRASEPPTPRNITINPNARPAVSEDWMRNVQEAHQ